MESSILESIGVEIIGVMSPVSICMFLVVLLVYSLSSADPTATLRTAANLVYIENPTDSTSQKLEGALLNAFVFVILITLVTFLIFLLFYYNFTSFLKNYMRFSSFFILATMGGSIFLSIVQKFSIPIDFVTYFVLLVNFSVVGVLSVFSGGVPILLRQGYTVCLGIIVAAWFTKLPEWTTWVLLVALALYDLVAVLAPGGPLKLLVELASSRDEELPALVYEARPTVNRNGNRGVSNLGFLVAGVSDSNSIELQMMSRDNEIVGPSQDDVESFPLVDRDDEIEDEDEDEDEERSPLVVNEERESGERGIRLGLGDFVFYSVLVGRAAMYDLMTVYACYLAIISGLGCTLILLSVCRRALPALPISIALGVIFYFLTRLFMEPFIVGAATNLMMF